MNFFDVDDLIFSDDAWELDIKRWEWRQLPECFSGKGRLWHVGAEIDGNAYVYGGVRSNILSHDEICVRTVVHIVDIARVSLITRI